MTFTSGQLTKHRKIMPVIIALIAGLMLVAPRSVRAHPMGNFSISHFAGFRIEAGTIDLRYILDMAEIPTFQEMQATGIVPAPDDPRVVAYLASKAEALRGGLVVTLNRRPLAFETVSKNVIFPPGAGNLPTMKIGVEYRANFREWRALARWNTAMAIFRSAPDGRKWLPLPNPARPW